MFITSSYSIAFDGAGSCFGKNFVGNVAIYGVYNKLIISKW